MSDNVLGEKCDLCLGTGRIKAVVGREVAVCPECEGTGKRLKLSSPVLGETVMQSVKECTAVQDGQCNRCCAVEQDSHTRKKLIEQGWKSPEELKAIAEKFGKWYQGNYYGFTHNMREDFQELITSLEANDAK